MRSRRVQASAPRALAELGLLAASLALAAGAVAGASLEGGAEAKRHPSWGYAGELGPAHWGELSPAFRACKAGRNQSPIDIVDAIDAHLPPIEISHRGSTISMTNNGHTLQIEAAAGSTLEVDGRSFDLVQFHFHSPSEHRIEGESFPLEAHFVHRNEHGELAVLAVLYRVGPGSRGFRVIGEAAPEHVADTRPFEARISELDLLPESRAHYRYSGSLTTPPCTEGVLWLILRATGSVPQASVENFIALIGKDARDPQPLNGRLVLR